MQVKNMKCHYRNKPGHIQRYHFQWKKENKGKRSKQKVNDHDDDCGTTTTT